MTGTAVGGVHPPQREHEPEFVAPEEVVAVVGQRFGVVMTITVFWGCPRMVFVTVTGEHVDLGLYLRTVTAANT